ncbi:MAG: dCMP deaminase family protein [Candidatus Methanomethylophilaceae archaeon]
MEKCKWNEYFMGMAELTAKKSKDRSTKVGCVIVNIFNSVISAGYNGFPRGVDDDLEYRHQRPFKLYWTEHAERNAIYNAARYGIPTDNCSMYISGHGWPCSDCARAIAQSGISKVVTMEGKFEGEGDWAENCRIGSEILIEAGVALIGLTPDFQEIIHV